jgi:hypothetical protein
MSTTIQEREAPPVAEPVYPLHPEFLEAAAFLRERGWCQDTREDHHGRVCLVEAIETVADVWDASALGFDDDEEPEDWNDHPDRTLSEVLERLERAAWGL